VSPYGTSQMYIDVDDATSALGVLPGVGGQPCWVTRMYALNLTAAFIDEVLHCI
jgi:hypothetical protein